ncbi:hypothetical protein DEA8626_03097 [Defluviimonas aquaemixtae]|uniref:YcaO domain-containing protein n=1 Tax=Albidovulum aquaemixtae TaxID=1542388 RepID=A0A2R8BKZ3_9RHOB|nr:YcaO-like family protein [Defluviimonas aquaemixtae]SPH24049.1 hypothetical protein DEA8626_03097 [Defluviimonas aquaemixtae]
MLSGPLPDVSGLFYAVDVVRSGDATISATGIDETPAGALRLCASELVERLACSGSNVEPADTAGRRVSGMGIAAGPTQAFARERALLEALERLAGCMWWNGRLASAAPSSDTVAAAAGLRRRWRRRKTRRTDILELPLTGCARIVAAVSSTADGRGICIGLAARRTGSEAARGALKELLQMEFGLQVISYRQANGIAPSAREAAILERADNLLHADCAPLIQMVPRMPAPDVTDQKEELYERLREEGYIAETRRIARRNGLFVTQATVARHWDVPAGAPGPWARWALYL